MSLSGSIAVAVEFRNSTTSTGVQSLKTIEMRDTTAYATGKVAIVSGTVGTTGVELWSQGGGIGFGGYRDATGQLVTLGSVSRIAMRGSSGNGTVIEDTDLGIVELLSISNRVAVGDNIGQTLLVRCLDGTSSFSAVLYGA